MHMLLPSSVQLHKELSIPNTAKVTKEKSDPCINTAKRKKHQRKQATSIKNSTFKLMFPSIKDDEI